MKIALDKFEQVFFDGFRCYGFGKRLCDTSVGKQGFDVNDPVKQYINGGPENKCADETADVLGQECVQGDFFVGIQEKDPADHKEKRHADARQAVQDVHELPVHGRDVHAVKIFGCDVDGQYHQYGKQAEDIRIPQTFSFQFHVSVPFLYC